MTKHIPAMAARKNFGEILESVFYRGDEVVVERAGKPMGVLIPMAQYEKLEQQRAEAFASIEEVWTGMPETPDLEAAEQEVLDESMAVRYSVSKHSPR